MKKKKNKLGYIISFIFTLYLVLRTSYMILFDNVTIDNYLSKFFVRLFPIPWKFCFHPYSLFWFGIYIIAIIYINYYDSRPKASPKWKEIEHGSNDFQTKEEIDDFLEKCTDKIIDFTADDINGVELFLKGVKEHV